MNLRNSLPFVVLWVALHLPMVAGAQAGSVITIGDTNNYSLTSIPFSGFIYQPCYTQELILNSELGGEAVITGFGLYCGSNPSPTGVGSNCTVYLARTFVEDMSGGLVPFGTMFEQVLVSPLPCDTGWNHYTFDTPFHYYGFENLLLVIDAPGFMTYSYSVYAVCGITPPRSMLCRTFHRLYDILHPTPSTGTISVGYIQSRNLMRLYTEPVGESSTCKAPTVWTDSVGADAVRLVWTPGGNDTAWAVEALSAGDTVVNSSGMLNDSTYTMTGLELNKDYIFRVIAYCSDTFSYVTKHIHTAPCLHDSLPYTEGLVGLTDLPPCWQTIAYTAGGSPVISSGERHRTSRSVRMNGGNVVLPNFNVSPDSLELYFWAKSGHPDSSVNLYVGMVIDPFDSTTFVPIDTVSVTHAMEWIPVVVRFDSYTRPFGRIAIVSADPNKPYIYIDDIEVCRAAPCRALPMMIADNVTDTSALLHWTDTAGALYYDVAYCRTDLGLDSAQIVTHVSGDSLMLTGLEPYTQYDVYVRPECGVYTAHWSPVRTFRTLCIPLIDTMPYIEDFEAYAINNSYTSLTCWQGFQGEQMAFGRAISTYPAHSGNYLMHWVRSSSVSGVQQIIFPAIDTAVLPINTLKISFWAENGWYNWSTNTILIVGVMEDPDVDTSFVPLDTVTVIGRDWVRYDVSLENYSGPGRFITVRSYNSSWEAYLDDFKIDLISPCPNVRRMRMTGLSSSSVTVEWISRDSTTVWQSYIDTSATATPVEDSVVLTAPRCTFDSLMAGRTYYVWVRALCARGDTSEWEGPIPVVPGTWNMRNEYNDTLMMCGVSLYDDGGPSGAFSAQTSTLVILPDGPGSLVSISGLCDIGGSSTLTIHDGVGTAGPVLWTKGINNTAAVNFGPVVSSTGALTLYFRGITWNTPYNGFDLQVSCVPDQCVIHYLQPDSTMPATDSTIAITWECNGASYYEVEYGPVGFTRGTGTFDTASTNSFVITGLASLDRREVYVRSICGEGDTGAWVWDIFSSQPCDDAVYRVNYDSTMRYGAQHVMPIGINAHNYSYVQTIIDSVHLSGLEGGITALAFKPTNIVEGDHQNNISVWLVNVADTDLTAGPIVPDAGHRFVKVIDSANFRHAPTTEWQMISFDHPFMWDGHKNLLVAVLRNDGGAGMQVDYAGHFHYSNNADNLNCGYVITSWDRPLNIDSARTYVSPYYGGYSTHWVGDLRLYTNTCDLPICVAPVVDSVSGDHESVTIIWSGTSSEFQVAIDPFQPDSAYPVSDPVSVSGNQHTFTGLLPNTQYAISVRQSCMADSLGYSDWVTTYYSTDSYTCLAADSLAVSNITQNAVTFDWVVNANSESLCDSLWQLEVWTPGSRHVTYTPTGHPFTVEGLAPGTEYCAYIHGYCGSECQILGEWCDTLFFSTLVCPEVTGFDTTGVTTISVALVWDAEPLAQSYVLEYGPVGFDLGTGTVDTVLSNSTIVTGLTPATAYDFYVRTICDTEWYSAQYASLLNVVTLSPVGIAEADATLQFLLLPNPAKGVTTIQIEGLHPQYAGILHVAVSDLAGRDVLVRDIECAGQCQVKLDIEGLSDGAYFVRVSNGQTSSVRKLIVK